MHPRGRRPPTWGPRAWRREPSAAGRVPGRGSCRLQGSKLGEGVWGRKAQVPCGGTGAAPHLSRDTCTLPSPGAARTVATAHPLGCCPPSWGPLWGGAHRPGGTRAPAAPHRRPASPRHLLLTLSGCIRGTRPQTTPRCPSPGGGGRGGVGLRRGKEHVVPLGGR